MLAPSIIQKLLQSYLHITATFEATKNMVVIDRWSFYKNTVSNDHLTKWALCTDFLKKSASQIWRENYLGWNQHFTNKFVEAANNFKKLLENGKHFMKFEKIARNFTKFVEFANNFTKFVGLAKNFYEVRRSCEQLCKVSRSKKKLYKVRKIYEQLHEVCATRQQPLESP